MSGITITYEVVKKLKQTYIATYCLLFFSRLYDRVELSIYSTWDLFHKYCVDMKYVVNIYLLLF